MVRYANVKGDYLQLAYLQQTLGILRQNEVVLDQLIQDATAHYQVGQGMQQDVLQAQVWDRCRQTSKPFAEKATITT